MRRPEDTTRWILRIGACCCFLGHGAFGIITKSAWLPFFGVMGIGHDVAYRLMPLVGAIDVVLGVLALLQPRAALLAYMVLWTAWTAALRPLTGMPVWEMLERAGNVGVPLALLLMCARGPWRMWLRASTSFALDPERAIAIRRTLIATTALLLVGHGALALQQKPEIVSHVAVVLSTGAFGELSLERTVVVFGIIELALAALLVARPSVGLCLTLGAWKLATESLFLAAGAPTWEFVERGGSYAAPLALAALLWRDHRVARGIRSSLLAST